MQVLLMCHMLKTLKTMKIYDCQKECIVQAISYHDVCFDADSEKLL